MITPNIPSPIQPLSHPMFEAKGIEVFVKRDDLVHPQVMGNKWRKLKYNLSFARESGKKRLVTFGGAYSNHIAAVAFAARYLGFESKGIIRGEELDENANPTLKRAAEAGMELIFVHREKYRTLKKGEISLFKTDYLIPEGGTNCLAIKGMSEVIDEIELEFDLLATSIGTGGTICGLLKGLGGNGKVLGFSALKGEFIKKEVNKILADCKIPYQNFEIETGYHFDGYGKFNQDLISFINDFYEIFSVPLEPIYTGKMFYGVWDKIKNGQIAEGSKVLMYHSGGLQGIEGFNARNPNMPIRIPEV